MVSKLLPKRSHSFNQVVQIESNTINGSLAIPFNVTEEGRVGGHAYVHPYRGSAFNYGYYFSISPDGEEVLSYGFPINLKSGTYYFIVQFELYQGLDTDYYLIVYIYERVERSNPYLPKAIAFFITGIAFIVTSGYALFKSHKTST